MTVESLLGILIIGGLAGWIAGLMVRGKGLGIVMNIVVGIIGAFIGTWVFDFFGITAGGTTIGNLIVAIVGAAILLGLLQLVRRA